MAHPETIRSALPLTDAVVRTGGPPSLTSTIARQLRLLGAHDLEGTPTGSDGVVTLTGVDGSLSAEIAWAGVTPAEEVTDEATAQAATGVAHVHGRRDGTPRGLAVDYLSMAAGVLASQGLLAGLIGRYRGLAVQSVRTAVDLAGLLAVAQYLACAAAEEDEAVPLAPGGPPFTTSDGVVFEVETLDSRVWVTFWQRLGTTERLAGSAWRSFQFRYATACCPLPPELHARARAHTWDNVRAAADRSGVSLCVLTRLVDRLTDSRADAPWLLSLLGPGATAGAAGRPASADIARPLAGFTVVEAGRRIQAPLATCVLRMLGADVIRIEPPGGDPLRGMPPTCGGLSARWLALNRGKGAVEIDIKSAAGRAELLDLVAGADVFLHNWAPGTAERLGLDDGDLSAVNPRLVYAYTSGWAGRLPDAPLGTDFMVQARSGLAEAVRPSGEAPAPSLMTLLDVFGGLIGAEAVLAGLLLRERERRGVRVDSSLLGAAEMLTGPALLRAARGEQPRAPERFRRPLRTADGWVAVADDDVTRAQELTGPRGRLSDQGEITTAEAVRFLRAEGVRVTAVTAALDAMTGDPRFAAALTRDAHGALIVPTPWRFS
ncbi:CoA transferase [Microbispora hainanensis]|uniref:CoA transferase n=1 Tax=Microbispora TaxID=2005 RepID=UPI001159634E|nr:MULTISPECIES: CoA transferase [Microbispora]NJP29542.1 CoA transferase [Microbispora sp. CL1-1]TQS05009.1 CoA transferase [Microbispora sp. SCL1-1]